MFYPIVIEQGSDTEAFGVIVPDIQGCFSAGDTFVEALDNAKEAIAEHLEILAEDDAPIPQASSVSCIANKPEYVGMIYAVVEVI